MFLRILAYIITILAFILNQAEAEECRIQKQSSLPITFNGFMPTVPAYINSQEVNIGIDTGSYLSIISSEIVEKLGLPTDTFRFTNLMGTDGFKQAGGVIVDTMQFGNVIYRKMSMPVIRIVFDPGQLQSPDNSDSDIKSVMAGLIGMNILSKYDIEFDMPGHTLTLNHIEGCSNFIPSWQRPFSRVPVTITDSKKFILPVLVNGHKMTAIFDTGASEIILSRSAAERIGITDEMLRKNDTDIGYGMAGKGEKIYMHQFNSIKIGEEVFNNLAIGITDFPADEADMLIGESYMKNHKFLLSYASKSLFIKKAEQAAINF